MKLHMHPVSTTSRPIMMFCANEKIEIELVMVDLMTGAHFQEPFSALNPNHLVPVLEDGDFVLTESSAILKYIADKVDSPCYPKDLKQRARVNEAMDWFNTNLYREYGYHLVYPQVYPTHERSSGEITAGTVNWGLEKSKPVLELLNGGWRLLGAGHKYLTSDSITIADYLGAEYMACGDLIQADLHDYPNIVAWMNAMKSLPNWDEVHEVHDGFAASMAEKSFTTIA